ncbi:hypothetical protein PENTCL1PPCAC_21579 [Pristionchus entomophagus]|uniref:Membrane transporter n=1 Tax=Pristionchus entomophagus TaxID=358040 RepID=A0AAV5TY46_9BILA|nr:hypothetical protein PENTCL1PPCAC_21579 [Pristionchus entomophagus]
MIDARYALITTIGLGIAHMCMYAGYRTGSLIVEPMLHSVHDRRPEEMDEDAGFYGEAIMNGFNMVGHIVAPAFLLLINAKWSMMIGSVAFTLSFAAYTLMNQYVIYVSRAVLGLIGAAFNAGQSLYIMQISTPLSIEKINGLEWALGTGLSTLLGGCIYIPMMLLDPNTDTTSSANLEYSDGQIRLIFGAFTVIGIISNVIFCFLPNRPVANSISSDAAVVEKRKNKTILSSLGLTLQSFFDPTVLQLTPHFLYVGWQNFVWLATYPTALQFTGSLSQDVLLPAFYGILFSLGSLLMGLLTAPLSRRITRFGQTPCLILAACLQLLCGILIVLSTPNRSTIEPNTDPSLLISPNVPIALAMGFLFGLLDGCNNTNRTVICASALPGRKDEIFGISRFYQALAGTVLLVCSPMLPMYWNLAIEAVLFIVGAAFYLRVCSVVNKRQQFAQSETDTSTLPEDSGSIASIIKEVDSNGNHI